jgi:hypothetical protein
MNESWQYQLRIDVSAALAPALRDDPSGAALAVLHEILCTHRAVLRCQFDAFADYVREAEQRGAHDYPLYAWTRQTLADPDKQARYLRSFTLYVEGREVYDKAVADALEAQLAPLAGRDGIERVRRFDTNPAHNPQPPAEARG